MLQSVLSEYIIVPFNMVAD